MHEQQEAGVDGQAFQKHQSKSVRAKRFLSHGLEALVIAVTVIVCASHNVSAVEIRAHAAYALASMSFLLCAHSCQTKHAQAMRANDVATQLLLRDKKSLGKWYSAKSKGQLEELKTYFITSSITLVCWIATVICYAMTIHDEEFHFAIMGLPAGIAGLLAIWKLICITRDDEGMSIEALATAFSDTPVHV